MRLRQWTGSGSKVGATARKNSADHERTKFVRVCPYFMRCFRSCERNWKPKSGDFDRRYFPLPSLKCAPQTAIDSRDPRCGSRCRFSLSARSLSRPLKSGSRCRWPWRLPSSAPWRSAVSLKAAWPPSSPQSARSPAVTATPACLRCLATGRSATSAPPPGKYAPR